jgi:hypothetical protein
MPEIDPYAVLGVPRTATREEIARAYRALAKRHHPDAGAPPSPTMARINEAWSILGSTSRRARWDADHRVVQPPHWAAAPPEPMRTRGPGAVRAEPAQAPPPPSRFDSPWAAAAVVLGAVVLIAVVLTGLAIAGGDADDRVAFATDEISFLVPSDWVVEAGSGSDSPEHRVVAHLVTYGEDRERLCTTFGDPCRLTIEMIPPGNASVIVTAWAEGEPPLSLAGSRLEIGGRAAAYELREVEDDVSVARWQLGPDGFPERWIEVRAVIRGLSLDRDRVLRELDDLLETATLGPPSGAD